MENFKKARGLNELAPEPVIRSCDSGQRISCFDSGQLTIIWMTVYYQVTYRLEAFHIGFPVARTDGHVMTKIS